MATTLPGGAVAVQILCNDSQFQQTINQVNTSVQKFQTNIQNGITKMPGFGGKLAWFRDFTVTFAAMDHVLRRFVIAPLRTAISDISEFGNTYAKMSRRVGMGAKDLSLLGYAAEQTGASVQAMGDGMRYLNRNLAMAEQGSKAAQDAFALIGIDSNRLKALDKKEQFLAVAEAIRRVGDEAKQTDVAMKIFGKGGTSMLPLFQEGRAGIQELMKEADNLGIGISDEDAAKAENLNSAITRIQRSMQGFRRAAFMSMVEPMTKVLDWGSKVFKNLREWVSGFVSGTGSLLTKWFNGLRDVVAKNARWLTALGGASLAALATFAAWKYVPTLFGAITTAVKGLSMSLLKLIPIMLMNPIGLIATGFAAATAAVLYFTGTGPKLMSWFGDIAAMIKEGRIVDAVKLMWLEIQLLFEEGKLTIMNRWNEVAAAISEPFMTIYDTVAGVVQPVMECLNETFQGIGQRISDQFTGPLNSLMEWFGGLWENIKGGWDALMNDLGYVIVGTWWSIATGINNAIAAIRNAWNNLLTGIQKFALTFAKNLINIFTSVARALDFTGIISSAVDAANTQIDKMIAGVEKRGIQKGLDIEGDKKGFQSILDDKAQKSLGKVEAAKANAPKTNDRIETLKLQIAELKKPVTTPSERTKQINEMVQQIAKGGGASSIVQGTMNKQDILGGALAYMASEKDHSEDIADDTGKMVGLLERIERKEGGITLH